MFINNCLLVCKDSKSEFYLLFIFTLLTGNNFNLNERLFCISLSNSSQVAQFDLSPHDCTEIFRYSKSKSKFYTFYT